MCLERSVKQVIPSSLDQFAKLTSGRDPYYFKRWDRSGSDVVLRYWFWNKTRTEKNAKRVFVHELAELLRQGLSKGGFSRADYDCCCPRTLSDGSCGYVVMARILEHLGVVQQTPSGFRIIDETKAKRLIQCRFAESTVVDDGTPSPNS